MSGQKPFSGPQRAAMIYGMIAFILILFVCQLWLVTATVNAFLGGDRSIVWPAGIASGVCLALNIGLLWYLYRIETPS